MREALRALELVVVIDVALTETARQADYVLPAASQYEKRECTFFNLEFPNNVYHLRRPIFELLAGTLPEYEIHSRLCRALGAYTDADLAPLPRRRKRAVRRSPRRSSASPSKTGLAKLAAVLLYESLGPTLVTPEGAPAAGAAAVWGLAQRCALGYADSIRRAGITGDGDRGQPRRRLVRSNPCVAARPHVHCRRLRRDDAPRGDIRQVRSRWPCRRCSPSSTRWRPALCLPGGDYPFVLVCRRAPLVDRQHHPA